VRPDTRVVPRRTAQHRCLRHAHGRACPARAREDQLHVHRPAAAAQLRRACEREPTLMGLFTGLLLLPLAPLRGTIWVAERLAEQAAQELDDEVVVRRLLAEAELAFDRGELTLAEFEQVEDELL